MAENSNFNFDAIAGRYDLCNHLFSLGLDRLWRRRVVRAIEPRAGQRVLDLCCGTGDLALAFARHGSAESITGLDISEAMIRRAQQKQGTEGIHWMVADATRTGLPDASFDAVTCAFGLRNIPDRAAALREIRRLLRPGGRVAILEFALPDGPLLRGLYRFYLRYFMPGTGRLLFGSAGPLRYLAESVEEWNDSFDLPRAAAGAGLRHEGRRCFTGGIVALDLLRAA